VSDLAAVGDPELLVTCLEGAFEEVLALGVPAAVDACVAEPAAVAS
jgi:hypothetical protein